MEMLKRVKESFFQRKILVPIDVKKFKELKKQEKLQKKLKREAEEALLKQQQEAERVEEEVKQDLKIPKHSNSGQHKAVAMVYRPKTKVIEESKVIEKTDIASDQDKTIAGQEEGPKQKKRKSRGKKGKTQPQVWVVKTK